MLCIAKTVSCSQVSPGADLLRKQTAGGEISDPGVYTIRGSSFP